MIENWVIISWGHFKYSVSTRSSGDSHPDYLAVISGTSLLKITGENAYQSSLGLDQGSILSVHLVIETAGVAEIVSVTVPSPQRG
jgi:hypothetical protein